MVHTGTSTSKGMSNPKDLRSRLDMDLENL